MTTVTGSQKETHTHRSADAKKGRKFKDLFFLSTSIIVGLTVALYLRDTLAFRKVVHPEVPLRSFYDLIWILLAALGFGASKRLFHLIFYKPCLARLEKKNIPDMEVLKTKLTKNLFDAVWYFSMFVLGLFVSRNDPNMPFFYWGSGSWDSLGNNWPNHNFGLLGRVYFILHLGHHYHNLIHHSIAMKDIGNYHELILHHVVTTSTTTLAYFINFEEYALFTLLSHDISDSILTFAKFTRDISLPSIVVNTSFSMIVISWIGFRLSLAPKCYWIGTLRLLYWKDPFGPRYTPEWEAVKYSVNLVCVKTLLLILLNVIWLYWILQIAYRKLFKGASDFSSVNEGEYDELKIKKNQ